MTATALILSGEHLERLRAMAEDVRDWRAGDLASMMAKAELADQMADLIMAPPYLSHAREHVTVIDVRTLDEIRDRRPRVSASLQA